MKGLQIVKGYPEEIAASPVKIRQKIKSSVRHAADPEPLRPVDKASNLSRSGCPVETSSITDGRIVGTLVRFEKPSQLRSPSAAPFQKLAVNPGSITAKPKTNAHEG